MRVLLPGNYLPLSGGTMTGDLNLGANKLRTTNLLFKELAATRFAIRDAADAASQGLWVNYILADTYFRGGVDGAELSAYSANLGFMPLKAYDTGIGLAEIARLKGAATAYFNLISGRACMSDVDIRRQMIIWGALG